LQDIEKDYTAALVHYLTHREEAALLRGYEAGRRALADGLGVLDMATIHWRAVSQLMSQDLDAHERERLCEGQMNFFVEALSPFEMAHRAFKEANTVLRHLNEMLEAQAKRIAYALHDEAGQLLASVHFVVTETARELPWEKAKGLAMVQELMNEIEERLRNLSHELRPPVLEDLGLSPALELLADGVSKRWGLPVRVCATLTGEVPPTIETTVYRITQEALTNAARHAKATQAFVDVRQLPHKIVCSIRDDGVGLPVNPEPASAPRRGLGLLEIKERVAALGGVLYLGPHTTGGTDLTVEIPLET
jgi:signal transduction histidine kinase